MAGKTPFLKGSAMVLGIPFGTSLNMLPTSSNLNPTTDEQKSTNSETFNSETLMVQPHVSPKVLNYSLLTYFLTIIHDCSQLLLRRECCSHIRQSSVLVYDHILEEKQKKTIHHAASLFITLFNNVSRILDKKVADRRIYNDFPSQCIVNKILTSTTYLSRKYRVSNSGS